MHVNVGLLPFKPKGLGVPSRVPLRVSYHKGLGCRFLGLGKPSKPVNLHPHVNFERSTPLLFRNLGLSGV